MSRDINALLPHVARKVWAFMKALEEAGITVLVTCTVRTPQEQEELYAQGRTRPGRIVTNAKAWQSWHNVRRAVDIVPLRNGKPVWGTQGVDLILWRQIGEIGEAHGLEWAGRWRKFREYPHFQVTDGLTLEQARTQL